MQLKRAPKPVAQPDEVLLIGDMAKLLRTSVRTIKRQLRAGTFFIPELPTVDYRHRWSRARFDRAMAEDTKAGHAAQIVASKRKRA
jgi:hypothetical protein